MADYELHFAAIVDCFLIPCWSLDLFFEPVTRYEQQTMFIDVLLKVPAGMPLYTSTWRSYVSKSCNELFLFQVEKQHCNRIRRMLIYNFMKNILLFSGNLKLFRWIFYKPSTIFQISYYFMRFKIVKTNGQLKIPSSYRTFQTIAQEEKLTAQGSSSEEVT
jgi:hypothetical protein